MNKKSILVGSLAFSLLFSKAQNKENSTFEVNETEIDLVYNHYIQDGDNSAVTGGEGTEKLSVFGPTFNLKRTFGKNQIGFQFGIDVISSASTDRIDRVMSSASRTDYRGYSNLNYSRYFEKSKLSVNIGLSGSVESDYLSIGKHIGITKTSKNDMRTFSADLQIFNDDLRWRSLEGSIFGSPQFLIYPEELRFQEWYDDYRRDSYNLNLGLTQIVDQRNSIGLFSVFSYQRGLLATPFHRIFFSDDTQAVERFPLERYKTALSLKWNRFIGGSVILRNKIGGYTDSFGILGLTLENETAIKLSPKWTFLPSFRFYVQDGSKYFAPLGEHDPSASYYTSDFDLSSFRTFKFGMGWRHWPASRKNKGLNNFSIYYFYYDRSNGLNAHTISTAFNFKGKRKPRSRKK